MSMYDHPLYPMLRTFLDEPDFYDSCAFGLPIHMRRNHAKAWCGYVGVSNRHNLFGCDYTTRVPVDRSTVLIRQQSPLTIFLEAHKDDGCIGLDTLIDCPGGLTWAKDRVPWGGLPGYWYFGFDCSHYNDLTPKDIIQGMADRVMYYGSEAQYRSFEWALRETRKLAETLAHFEATEGR